MKTIISALILLAIHGGVDAQTYPLHISESTVEWEAEKITGQHRGSIQIIRGELTMISGKLSKGEFEIDMTSIACTDLEGEDRRELEAHLNSPDFFNSTFYPTALLKINKATPRGKNKYKIEGIMTIKGITHHVEFNAVLIESGNEVSAFANLTIDRTEFKIRYGSDSFFDDLGDMAISDTFKLKIALKASSEAMN